MSENAGFRILAICSGNVCRSPLAELLLRRALAAHPLFSVTSAGTIARPTQEMTVEMVEVAARYGVPSELASAHQARRLDEAGVEHADLVLGLTREHRARALRIFPGAVKRAFTLREFARLVAAIEAAGAIPATTQGLIAEAVTRRGQDQGIDASLDDIEDPIGLAQEVYDHVGAQIAEAVDVIARVLSATAPDVRGPQGIPNSGGLDLSFSFRQI